MKKKLIEFLQLFKKRLTFSKRQEFVVVTLLLTAALIATQVTSGELRFDLMCGLAVLAYILSAIALREGLHRWEWLTLLVLPAYFTAAVFLFYYLLPTRWLTRLPIALLYAIGMYAILLTENIYNVATGRTIQLIRAAHSVGFLLTLVTTFFLTDTMLSLRLPFYTNIFFSLLIIFPLTVQTLWPMELTGKISELVWLSSITITFIIVEFAGLFSVWPLKATIAALFMTTLFYTLVGMTQQYLIGRLFAKTAREFVTVLMIVLGLVFLTTRWGVGF